MFNSVKSVQSVSELTASIKGLIETSHPFVNIQGEVSNLRIPYSGHMYFILKDDNAQIRAVLFKGQRRFLAKDFKDGDEIICRGRITVYEPRGDYQIIVDSVQQAGHGAMHLKYAALKEKLANEGLFAEHHKKKIPFFTKKICLITSPTGAAVHDFLDIALKKYPNLQIEIIATPMQGDHAPELIKQSLQKACARNWAEAIVLCRGGGSMEDLWAFNDESLARAIWDAPIPVISAIGHEVDFTIADFVADLRCPTPTAAAEDIVQDYQQLKDIIYSLQEKLQTEITQQLKDYGQIIQNQIKFLGDPRTILDRQQLKMDVLISQLERAFSRDIPNKQIKLANIYGRLQKGSPENTVQQQQHNLSTLMQRMVASNKKTFQNNNNKLQQQALMLDALSPLAVLGRGYTITSKNNTLLTSVHQTKAKDILSIKMQDGSIQAKTLGVTATKQEN